MVPHAARRLVKSRHETVAITHAAIMRGLDLVPHDETLIGHAVAVDAHGFDAAADHQAVEPLLCPLYLAFEMAAAFRNAWRAQHARCERREPCLDELVLAAAKRQSADQDLVEHHLLERHHI